MREGKVMASGSEGGSRLDKDYILIHSIIWNKV